MYVSRHLSVCELGYWVSYAYRVDISSIPVLLAIQLLEHVKLVLVLSFVHHNYVFDEVCAICKLKDCSNSSTISAATNVIAHVLSFDTSLWSISELQKRRVNERTELVHELALVLLSEDVWVRAQSAQRS